MSRSDHDALAARIGTLVADKYRLIRLLGAGGMGAVYEAENTWTQKTVALKLMLGDVARDSDLAARFIREARAASKIEHPNVVQIFDMGADAADGALFIVQEFLSGVDLEHLLQERGVLGPQEALEILTPAMAALIAAHDRGVHHRDVKPANLLLANTPSGRIVKLIDFGIAKIAEHDREMSLTRTGAAIGTPLYMSPEAARGERDVGAHADIWAMGVVLFECLSGRLPFDGDNYHAVLAAVLTEQAPRLDVVAPSIPSGIADVVARALERDRRRRFASMREFLSALLSCSTYQREDWHSALRATHRKSIAMIIARDTVDDDLVVTPQLAALPRPSSASMDRERLTATTLGRASREVSIVSSTMRSRVKRVVAAVAAIGTVGVLAMLNWRSGTAGVPHISSATPAVDGRHLAGTVQTLPRIEPSVDSLADGTLPTVRATAPRELGPATWQSTERGVRVNERIVQSMQRTPARNTRPRAATPARPETQGHNSALILDQ